MLEEDKESSKSITFTVDAEIGSRTSASIICEHFQRVNGLTISSQLYASSPNCTEELFAIVSLARFEWEVALRALRMLSDSVSAVPNIKNRSNEKLRLIQVWLLQFQCLMDRYASI